jgi:hypothetical protein
MGALRACPEFAESNGGFTWWKEVSGAEARTVSGTIRIGHDDLILECNSRQRLERGKALLSKLSGRLLRHVRDEFDSVQSLKRRALEKPGPAPSPDKEIPPEVRNELVTKVYEQHYAKWPDKELRALDGKTPRESVKTAAGRRKVSAMLRDLENMEEHKRAKGEPYFDVAGLRAELGLNS